MGVAMRGDGGLRSGWGEEGVQQLCAVDGMSSTDGILGGDGPTLGQERARAGEEG
jgi:hypothetical protein